MGMEHLNYFLVEDKEELFIVKKYLKANPKENVRIIVDFMIKDLFK